MKAVMKSEFNYYPFNLDICTEEILIMIGQLHKRSFVNVFICLLFLIVDNSVFIRHQKIRLFANQM